eukprot:CAMPEP_0118702022 /NCGR_PEP_ID=MMETSP0800-20121206/17619_1 /TAXON_ID=210618 ORGANISM="Striatella unipunctata, Strain CCMP2910" /NCGR_SAMPLE_ID=MMETSP0800 /ASSEMBLY_ACC=CAM_ASM_000638 /LENGTH=253 /DNA_ID=CAMNT_0006603095 /DNA_START=162 /DNA_END=920 /DNA_ORIENTATION=+
MSFQDVGKPGAKSGSIGAYGGSVTAMSSANMLSSSSSPSYSNQEGYAQVSDSILQYKRNIDILKKIAIQFGTKADGPVVETQYKVQVDVVKDLGQRIDAQLNKLGSSLSGTQASMAKSRATHVKLTRDYRLVEQTFKNLLMDTRQKRMAHQQFMEQQQRTNTVRAEEESQMQMQMQLQQERLNEEIMREREAEIRNINKGMQTVNAIYQDLAHLVVTQQENVDQIETEMEGASDNAKQGLAQIQKANQSHAQQ